MKPYYQDKDVTLFNDDCLKVLPQLDHVDMVFADPPYGVGFQYNSYEDVAGEAYKQFCIQWFTLVQSLSTSIVVTPGCNNLALWHKYIKEPRHVCIWTKTNSLTHGRITHFWCWEPILFYGDFKKKRGHDIFDYPISKQNDVGDHTCPKPLGLIEDIINNFSEPNAVILDPFAGVGTTMRAAKNLNRRSIGIEIDSHYCDLIIDRCRQQVMELNV